MTINWTKGEKLVLQAAEKHLERVTKVLADRVKQLTPIGRPETWISNYIPIDYTPGQLKSSWRHDYNRQTKVGTVFNRQPYAQRIENGWSKQRPAGMVKVAVKEFGDMVSKVAREGAKI